jgi:hypothetical protein
VTEGAVAHNYDTVLLTPWDHSMLDRTLFQVVENLITSQLALASNPANIFKVRKIEVADAPGKDFSLALKLLERRDRILWRMLAAPMQKEAVQPVGVQAS